ncbi:hypothetical protein Tsubulata_008930 [Turnera subulata]|uniref:Protein PLASTID MOVEMENT IMPAIRED 2 n=1 Tax=Turnera subulata TaxID=218843 RepID=A0A9Q0EZN9_9ROSI|nr:hypothetical protein Tsubulata_008930 [Turnera subulata]
MEQFQRMDRRVLEGRRRIGTVKAAINMYGERILEGSSSVKKPEIDLPEKPTSRARELHMANKDMIRYKESRKTAESTKFHAESELLEAKKTVKDLATLIEESNANLKAQISDVQKLKMSRKRENGSLALVSIESHKYAEVMKELESVKQELTKLKLDMAAVLEEKTLAEKEIEGSSSKVGSSMNSVEALKKEIEDANEEQVLVELAQIEAVKEFGEVEAQRKKEASEFSSSIEEARKKIKEVAEEIDRATELESKLDATMADVDVLQNELKLAKEMDSKVKRNENLARLGGSFVKGKEELEEDSTLLCSIAEELEAAKKELASVKEEGFQFMASMDIIRSELRHVTKETTRLNKAKEKADVTVQSLNSKLLRAKSKLESATAVEEKSKSILSNLSATLQQLKTEAEVARKEKKLVNEETASLKVEIQETESQIDLSEERLQGAMQELEAAKASERLALENLRKLIEDTMRSRASAPQNSSTITISKFEYEYLTGHAAAAEEIADKKVAAAQAWIEALKASEKEILMKMEMSQKDIKDARVEEEQKVYRTEKTISAKRAAETELRKLRQNPRKSTEAENLELALPAKSGKVDGALTPSRHGKHRNSASPGFRITPRVIPRVSSTANRKKKGSPNLGKFFGGKKISKDL